MCRRYGRFEKDILHLFVFSGAFICIHGHIITSYIETKLQLAQIPETWEQDQSHILQSGTSKLVVRRGVMRGSIQCAALPICTFLRTACMHH